jgi:ribosomal silencing factor RsfS
MEAEFAGYDVKRMEAALAEHAPGPSRLALCPSLSLGHLHPEPGNVVSVDLERHAQPGDCFVVSTCQVRSLQLLPDRIRTFLAQPQPAVIASVRPDGQPVSVATWYLLDGDEVLVNMDAGRRRLAYLPADPRVSLTVLDSGDWYTT